MKRVLGLASTALALTLVVAAVYGWTDWRGACVAGALAIVVFEWRMTS